MARTMTSGKETILRMGVSRIGPEVAAAWNELDAERAVSSQLETALRILVDRLLRLRHFDWSTDDPASPLGRSLKALDLYNETYESTHKSTIRGADVL